MKSGIYKITNDITGRSYIGSAVIITRRIADHRRLLVGNKHPNCHLQSSWDKHGPNAFSFSTLLICSKDNLIFYEQRAIDVYSAERKIYNLRPTANSQLGFRHSEKTRSLLRELPHLRAGRKASPEHRKAISDSLMGHAVSEKHMEALRSRCVGSKLSDEHRLKLSLAKLGKKQSPDTVLKRALAHVGKKRSAEARARMTAAQRERRAKEAMA